MDWSAIYRELGLLDNVVGVGRGYKWARGENTGREAAVVLVRRKLGRGELRRAALVPRRIGELASDVVEVGDIRLLGLDRTGEQRPAHPGVSVGHYKVSAGTFGAVVRDSATGEVLILSNNHVLANLTDGADGRAAAGDRILQPALYDGGDPGAAVIGHLKRFVPLYRRELSPRCRVARTFETVLNGVVGFFQPHYRIRVLREEERENFVDCAVAAPVTPEAVAEDILEIGRVNGIKEAAPGMTVRKSGRSSGLTEGTVVATEVTVRVEVGLGEYGVFADQVLAGPMSRPGDSGSLVLAEDNSAVGLLFAGSEQATMFSRIARVFEALGVTI